MTDISRHFEGSAGRSRAWVRIAVPDLKFWERWDVPVEREHEPREEKAELLALFKSDLRSLKVPSHSKIKLSDLPRSARIRAALSG